MKGGELARTVSLPSAVFFIVGLGFMAAGVVYYLLWSRLSGGRPESTQQQV